MGELKGSPVTFVLPSELLETSISTLGALLRKSERSSYQTCPVSSYNELIDAVIASIPSASGAEIHSRDLYRYRSL
jgi:hypothetical protein